MRSEETYFLQCRGDEARNDAEKIIGCFFATRSWVWPSSTQLALTMRSVRHVPFKKPEFEYIVMRKSVFLLSTQLNSGIEEQFITHLAGALMVPAAHSI